MILFQHISFIYYTVHCRYIVDPLHVGSLYFLIFWMTIECILTISTICKNKRKYMAQESYCEFIDTDWYKVIKLKAL